MNRQLIVLALTTLEFLLGQFLSLPVQAEPSLKHNLPIRQDDIAFGGEVLKGPLVIGKEDVFTDVMSIKGVRFSYKYMPKPRALALGTLSLSNMPGTGDAIVKLRVTVDGKPEPPVFFHHGIRWLSGHRHGRHSM
jgi:hypothetical protein